MIFISAGHNLKDPGAVYNSRKEALEMIAFRGLITKYFDARHHIYVADTDTESNGEYQRRIKTNATDVIIDLHLNAATNPTATGTEVIIANNASEKSKALASDICATIAQTLSIKNRGVKTEAQTARGKIGIVNVPGIAVLVEICFLSNTNDMILYDKHKDSLAKAIAQLLIKYDTL